MATKPVKAFISYSHKDRALAREVKEQLANFGVPAFLAHEDIKPSAAWLTTIQAELRGCDLFLPLLTNNFPRSKWTDQESGVALGLDKLIVPLRVDIIPYGFIGVLQAVHLNPDKPRAACRAVISVLIEQRPSERGRFLDGFIPKFADSGSYDEAGRYSSVLVEYDGYSTEQVQDVLRAIIDNRQIHKSRTARDNLNEFLKQYGKADPTLARKAKRVMGA
jgi:TIR domain